MLILKVMDLGWKRMLEVQSKQPNIKIGDLVVYKRLDMTFIKARKKHEPLGIVVDWHDSANGYVEVIWKIYGVFQKSPCHLSKLKVISHVPS